MPTLRATEMVIPAPESARNAGRLLILVGCMTCLLASTAFAMLGPEAREFSLFLPAGALAMAVAAALLLSGVRVLNRKEIVRLEDGRVVVESGRQRRVVVVGEDPLVEVEESRRQTALGPVFSWGIYVASTRERAPIVVRPEYFLEFRNLAEMLARGLGCRLVDRSAGEEPVVLEPDDLNLPFSERVKRRPDLLGEGASPVPPRRLRVVQEDGRRIISWRGSLLRSLAVVLPFPLLFLAFLAMPAYVPAWLPGDLGAGTYRGLLFILGLLTVVACLMPLAYNARLTLGEGGLDFDQRLLGAVVSRQSIPWSELEEVRVHAISGATRVEIFSDQTEILVGSALDPVGEPALAGWVAGEVRSYAAGRGA